MPNIKAYVLTKDEESNIRKCLTCLRACQIPVVVLDSGSTDRTVEIAGTFEFCTIVPHRYVDHATTYNTLTRSADADYVLILDADMEVSPSLWEELVVLADKDDWDVVRAPVQMYLEGRPLRFGSLYPPKAIFFRTGTEYFIPKGHGETLRNGLRVRTTRACLIHNDLKPYEMFLLSQVRYGRNLAKRLATGRVSLKDRLRAATPLMGLLYAFISLVVRMGVLAGRLGLIYALDRMIAVFVQYRVVLASKLKEPSSNAQDSRHE
jgi:glycosyltransferase involved in cell wall biosynthesis